MIQPIKDMYCTKKVQSTAKYYGSFQDVKNTYKIRDNNIKHIVSFEELILGQTVEKNQIIIADLDTIKNNENAIQYFSELLNKNIPLIFYSEGITRENIAEIFNLDDVNLKKEEDGSKKFAVKLSKLAKPMGNGGQYLIESHVDMSGESKEERVNSLLNIHIKFPY